MRDAHPIDAILHQMDEALDRVRKAELAEWREATHRLAAEAVAQERERCARIFIEQYECNCTFGGGCRYCDTLAKIREGQS